MDNKLLEKLNSIIYVKDDKIIIDGQIKPDTNIYSSDEIAELYILNETTKLNLSPPKYSKVYKYMQKYWGFCFEFGCEIVLAKGKDCPNFVKKDNFKTVLVGYYKVDSLSSSNNKADLWWMVLIPLYPSKIKKYFLLDFPDYRVKYISRDNKRVERRLF